MNIEESRRKLCDIEMGWEFGIWLAAKAHAEEMAKPACTVIYSDFTGKWALKHEGSVWCINADKAMVDKYAKDNGYRVVSE